MPDYQPFPIRPTAFGTVMDGTAIVADFVLALARAQDRYDSAGMLDTPPPPDPESLLRKLSEAAEEAAAYDDPTRPATLAAEAEVSRLLAEVIGAASEGEPGWTVYVGDHDRQLAADLLLAADDSDQAAAEHTPPLTGCGSCGHPVKSRHVVDGSGRIVCLEDVTGPAGADGCRCSARPALRLVQGAS